MNEQSKKIKITFIVLCFFFSIVLIKAFVLQIIDKNDLQERYNRQFFRVSKVFPNRGNIYDRNGSPLAINTQTFSIFTIPKNVKGGMKSYKKLSKIVPTLTLRKIKKKIRNRKGYTFLARKISLNEKQIKEIKKLGKEGGIYIESVPKRIYPNHELLAQTLGFVGVDNIGLSGMEYLYDEQLRGRPKITKYLKDAKGRPIKFESDDIGSHPRDLYLTIDKELQAIAEKALQKAVEKYSARKGGIGVMDSKTGEVLAVANFPTFDPNELGQSRAEDRKLAFVSDPFEPGSVFKILTVASSLEHKVTRPDTSYYCERGRMQVEDHIINEAESKKHYEWLSVTEIIEHSSNIGTTKIAFDLTFPKLKATLEKFGIGKKSGIEIPGESRGIFTTEENVSPLSLSNISFGQGIATTGIQMLAVYAAIANGGVYHKPTIIRDENKPAPEGVRVISEQTSKELTDMLIGAVESGTGRRAMIPYFKIAGKTSTAQRPSTTGGYDGYIPGFVGFPINVDNKFVIYAYVDDPQGKVYYGNTVAGPVFKEVAQYILYKDKKINTVNNYKISKAKSDLSKLKVRNFYSRMKGRNTVPDFLGLDKFSANNLARKLKLKLAHRGIGIVKSQSPEPGSTSKQGEVVKLFYSPPRYE